MSLDDDWKLKGACAGLPPEVVDKVFFPPEKKGVRTDTKKAKEYCDPCEVKSECLAWAVFHREGYGVFGGMSANARRKIPGDVKRRLIGAWLRKYPSATSARPLSRAS